MHELDLLTYRDIIAAPIAFLIGVLLLHFLILTRVRHKRTRHYLVLAFLLKIVGTIALALIYQYYYTYGDTFSYFQCAQCLNEAFEYDIDVFWEVLWRDPLNYSSDASVLTNAKYFANPENRMICKIAGSLSILFAKSYIAISLIFSFLAFYGSFLLYKLFCDRFHSFHWAALLCFFFVPSVIFWSSGLNKDSLALFAMAILVFHLFSTEQRSQPTGTVVKLLALLISVSILAIGKFYILLAVTFAWLLSTLFGSSSSIQSKYWRCLLWVFVILASIFFSKSVFSKITIRDTNLYTVEEKIRIIQNAQIDATQHHEGSGYDIGLLKLGDAKNNLIFLLKAIGVGFYRPFPWEVNKPIVLPASLESFFILIFSIWVLLRTRWFGLRIIFEDRLLLFCLIFSLTLAVIAGGISFNFGTLSRYRMPFLPFLIFLLFFLWKNRVVK